MVLKINDRIRQRQLTYFNDFKVTLGLDSFGAEFSFQYYFDPNNIEHKEMSCIGHYHTCTLEENGETVLTGMITSQRYSSGSKKKLSVLAGYSLPGILEDCDIPPIGLQSDRLNLRQIAEKYLKPFNIKMAIRSTAAAAMEEVYEEITAKADGAVKNFLSELAAQKNITITYDEFGRLVFTKFAQNQKPIFHFQDSTPSTEISLNFDGRAVHSHIYAIRQEDIDEQIESSESIIRNTYVFPAAVYRPRVIVQSSSKDTDVVELAKHERARELKALSVDIETDRWILNNKIIRPGNVVSITSPENFLYKRTDFMISSVELRGTPEKATASIHCVPKEVYTGAEPIYPFAGINLH